jgi:hypothetical protein
MTANTFADRFPHAEMSWMNEELPLWIRRQLLDFDMDTMIAASRASSYVCKELIGTWRPAAAGAHCLP